MRTVTVEIKNDVIKLFCIFVRKLVHILTSML